MSGSSKVAQFVDNAIPFVGGVAAAGSALGIAEQRVLNNMAYRSLTSADAVAVDSGLGLTARGTMTVEEHIMAAKLPGGNPWIATSRSENVALGYSSGNGTIPIYLGEVADATQVEYWKFAARNNNMYG